MAYNPMVNADVIDFIFPPEVIPQKLLEITKALKSNGNNEPFDNSLEEEIYKQILSLLRIRKGTDFSNYKQTTIRRRILRRMVMNKFEKIADYLAHLQSDKPEQDVLYQDLLIPVTGFFRDPKTFENLCESVFPHLIKNKSRNESIRIWVAGCSTGEEAYSIAMCFKEYLGDKQEKVQIFATDLSEPAIAKARLGIYSKNEVSDVPPQRLKEFFIKKNDGFQLNKQIREMCVFAVHNFLKDPPFSKIDFISCRNVLIYMEPYLQKKALTTFHYGLNPKGLLLLGKSETISSVPTLFASALKNDKLFARKDVQSNYLLSGNRVNDVNFRLQDIYLKGETKNNDFQKSADDIILSRYTPAGVVVNEALEIVHFRGKTGNYLEQSAGKPTHNLLQLAKPGLAFELRNTLHKARKKKEAVLKENIPLLINKIQRLISIEIMPLPNYEDPHYLILFHDSEVWTGQGILSEKTVLQKEGEMKVNRNEKNLRIQQLEQELEQLRDDLRSVTEEQEVLNEELQSTNEELLSSNEELQSLNEELETGKEELESSNEELTVINQEMIDLNEQLNEARKYTEAIVSTVREPMLVLDKNLRVRMATTVFYKTFRLSEQQTEGRLIYDVGEKQWDIPELHVLFEKILPEKSNYFGLEVNHHFPSIGKRTMVMNAREITREGGTEKLILLAIEDITESREATRKIESSEQRFRQLLLQSPFPIGIFKGENMVIDLANNAIKELWDKGDKVEGRSLFEVVPELNNQGFPTLLQEVYHTGKPYIGTEALAKLKRNGVLQDAYFNFVFQPYRDADDTITGVAIIANEVTTQALANKKIRANEENVRRLFQQTPVGIAVYKGENLVIEQVNDTMLQYWGRSLEEALNVPLWELLPEAKEQGFDAVTTEVFRTGKSYFSPESAVSLIRNGKSETIYAQFAFEPRRDEKGTIIGLLSIAYDVTEQVVSRKKVELNERRYMNLIHSSPVAVYTCDKDGYIQLYNEAAVELWGCSPQFGKDKWSGAWKIFTPDGTLISPDAGPMAVTIKTGKPVSKQEIIIERPSGERRHVLAHPQPVFDENGELTGAINTLVDITEIRKSQQILKEKEELFHRKTLQNEQLRAKELEEKVNKRTLQLREANEELLLKNEELGKMNKELESFAYISSHDLQEPLRKIQTFSARILKKEGQNLSDSGKDYFERMQSAAKRMQALIDDLLAYSRTNTTERNFEKTDLNQIVQDVKNELREVIEEKQAFIETHEMCDAHIIPFQFHQLLHNLFSNALKFSKSGIPPQIFVKSTIAKGIELQNTNPALPVGKLLPQEIYCHISVVDNGIGFEPEFKEKIFEIFQRLHGKEVFPGTGIGLAIVKKIVENHNGFIMATGQLGQGAAFDIYLPQN
jgi:two-component system CheB/CheR fusion protein